MSAHNRERETDEAARWWVRLGTRPPHEISQEDREEFTRWLRESPLHVAEMLHVAHVHDALEHFKLWEEIPVTLGEDDDRTVVSIREGSDNPSLRSALRDPAQRRVRSGRTLFAIAASAAALAVTTFILLPRLYGHVIATDLAERREVMLEDGSTVRLEPETALRVRIEAHERHVTLSRGRALFRVAKDPSRPFLVAANDTVVRAVGTAFGVEHKKQSIVVTVSEGKVAVLGNDAAQREMKATNESRPDAPSASARAMAQIPIFLTAGQQVTVQDSGATAGVHVVDTARALAWTEGRLVFDSAPLSEVVDEFNRYNHLQLRVEGPELARRPVSGTFEASDPETLIAFIRTGAHVTVTREGLQQVLITLNNAPP